LTKEVHGTRDNKNIYYTYPELVRTNPQAIGGVPLYEDATKALKLYVCGFGLNVKPCGLTVATVLPARTMVPAMVDPGAKPSENLLRPTLPSNDLVWPLPVSSVTVAGEARIATAQSVSLV
jgi:hypothetical protein